MSGVSRTSGSKKISPKTDKNVRSTEASRPSACSNAVHAIGQHSGNQAALSALGRTAPAPSLQANPPTSILDGGFLGECGWAEQISPLEAPVPDRAANTNGGASPVTALDDASTVQDPSSPAGPTQAGSDRERLDNRERRGALQTVPHNRQTGNACGTTSLSSILTYWGDREDVNAKTPGEVDGAIRDADTFTTPTAMQRYAESQGLSSSGINNGSIEQLREITQKGLVAQCFVNGGNSGDFLPHWIVVSAVYEDPSGETIVRYVDSGENNQSSEMTAMQFLSSVYHWQDPLPIDAGYHCFYIVYAPKSQEKDLPASNMGGVMSVEQVTQQAANIMNGAQKLGDPQLTQKLRGLLELLSGAASGVVALPAALLEVLSNYVDIPVVKELLNGTTKLISVPLAVIDSLLTGLWNTLFGDGDSEHLSVYKQIMNECATGEIKDVKQAVGWVQVLCDGPTTDQFEKAILMVLRAANKDGSSNQIIKRIGWRALATNLHGAEYDMFLKEFGAAYWASASLSDKKTAVVKHASRQARCGFQASKTILVILRTCSSTDIAEIDSAVRASSKIPLSERFNANQMDEYNTLRS